MELDTINTPAQVAHTGSQVVTVVAGESLKIEANGEDLLDIDVPVGKSWQTHLTVRVIETDV